MTPMIAKKGFRYGGRSLTANDHFDARPKDAKLLAAIGKADHAPVEVVPADSGLADLRAQYIAVTGTEADKRWKEARLRSELAESVNKYNRRDMQAKP